MGWTGLPSQYVPLEQASASVLVKCSTLPNAGGGLFAAVYLQCGTQLMKYQGCIVSATVMWGSGYTRGYVMRLGSRYVDARDPCGRLCLSTGTQVDVNSFSQDDWDAFRGEGVAWLSGSANLSRFVNGFVNGSGPGSGPGANAKFSKGWLELTRDVRAGEELFIIYPKDFYT